MKPEDIKIGKRVKYYPVLGGRKYEEATITHECFDICGTTCCMIDIRSSCVAIQNLEAL